MQATEATRTVLEFWQGLGIVSTAGAAGGMVSAVAMLVEAGLDDKRNYVAARGMPVYIFVLGRAVVGIGGAIAVLFAALSIGRYTNGANSIELLSLAALSFVAGSIGHRLLPLVAAQVEKQIGELQKKMEEAESKAELANQQVAEVKEGLDLERSVVDARAVANMTDEAPGLVERTREMLEKLRPQNPRHRGLNLVLARLYMVKMQSLEGAIKILNDFVAAVKGVSEQSVDLSDAWFNQACYYSIAMAKTADGGRKKQFEDKAIAALRESVSVLPSNLQDALTDEDLTALRETAAFKQLLAEAAPAGVTPGSTPTP